jgi:RHS repeat-associated protein
LVAVTVGTERSEFSYDGEQRRVRIVEKDNGVTRSDTRVVWCEQQICEERAADGTTVARRALGLGEQVGSAPQFFASDHLGSVHEVTDATPARLGGYEFDPWGRRTLAEGVDVTTVGFTGHRWQALSTLWQAWYRTYHPDLGRWVSEDPLGIAADGPNLYAYSLNNATTFKDPDGRKTLLCCRLLGGGLGSVSGQRHCFVVITGNPDVGEGAATGFSLAPEQRRGKARRNYRPDMDAYFKGAQCYDVPSCDPCREQRIDEDHSDPGPSANYRPLGPNSNTYARNLLKRNGCVPPPVSRAPGY